MRIRRKKDTPTVFRSYFRENSMNMMIKNLYVDMPEASSLFTRMRRRLSNLSLPILSGLFKKDEYLRKKIEIIDLTVLNDTLAVHLKRHSFEKIKLPRDAGMKYEKLALGDILNRQSQLLRQLLHDQHAALSEQSKEILEKEKERLKRKNELNNSKNNSR